MSTSIEVPLIVNADDVRQHGFASAWVFGFQLLEHAAREGRHASFAVIADKLRHELQKVPALFALNRETFFAAMARLEQRCGARAA